MRLKEFLSQTGSDVRSFAQRINRPYVTVYRYVEGSRIPTRPIMAEITEATNGQVTANDFFLPTPQEGG